MAKINNTSAYALSTQIVGDDIVIGSAGGAGGATKNFKLSDISAYVLGNAVTPTLDDVCQAGASTTTGITVAGTATFNGAIDANSTADISGAVTLGSTLSVASNATLAGLLVSGTATFSAGLSSAGPISATALNSTGGLLVSGTSFLGEIDSAGPADIADTLTLSKATGTGLQVDADANIDGVLYTKEVRPQSLSTLSIKSAGGVVCATVDILGNFNIPNTGKFRILSSPPSSAGDAGNTGEIAVDSDYIYVCTATDTWKRVAIATW